MAAATYRLISHFHSIYIYIYIYIYIFIYLFILFIKLYLDIMDDSNKSEFYVHLN